MMMIKPGEREAAILLQMHDDVVADRDRAERDDAMPSVAR